ncbi:hypothetical protein ACFQ3P_32670 [Paraburkholderia sabiae]|uniref:Fimbrial protein n=1 Tax=Paraburkholderia sabiae TaxID=273251 RepID=A0ABU9QJ47_9BURK|nr:hypothetical protein [Paraburkholderia sabiae]WJZ80014.1 hypothetical protein QEN71_43495 [Paraburkholderia sabiae]CAD6559521.1 hypothetical protein LMG24235_06698 [Paraburkholderia sabiae]
MRPIKALIAACMILSAGGAQAALKSSLPADVCGYLVTEKLSTRPWLAQDVTYGGCASEYREIGTATTGIANNLAFYVTGSATKVTQLELVLNLNQPLSDAVAIQELLKASKALSIRASGLPLPIAVEQAIVARRGDVTAMNGTVRISTIRKTWPNGKGYELHVVFE